MAQSRQPGTTRPAGDGGSATAGVLRAHLARSGQPVARAGTLPVPPPPSLERAVASAAAKAANRVNGLPATVEAVNATGITLAELPELLPEGALIAVVEGPGERLGVVAMASEIIASLIEMQAVGRISTRAAAPRRATRTDAALAAEFVNLLLEEIGAALTDHPAGEALAGLRYASYLDDARPLALMLEDGGYHGLTMTLRLGRGGERRGQVMMAVPGHAPPAALPRPQPANSAAEVLLSKPARASLARAVQQAPVALTAVLCRRTVSLRELRGLEPGALLSLPRSALDAVVLETRAGQPVMEGRLGEADGCFAVRPRAEAAGVDLSGTTCASRGPLSDNVPSPSVTEPPMSDLGDPDHFRQTAAASVIGLGVG